MVAENSESKLIGKDTMRTFRSKMKASRASVLLLIVLSFLTCQTQSAIISTKDLTSPMSDSFSSSEPIKIKLLAPSAVSKKHTRTRQNSRFLRNFPPVELLDLARQSAFDNDIDYIPEYPQNFRQTTKYGSTTSNWPMKSNRIDAGDSPIFYIKLPPVPYVYMPGVGYVSPHPYSNAPSMPISAFAGSGIPSSGMASMLGQESSLEQNQQSVISLPLKFLSNGRPHQIETPKRKKKPGIKDNSSENKRASLIPGGKYSFNGRPTAVFVVRSPVVKKKK